MSNKENNKESNKERCVKVNKSHKTQKHRQANREPTVIDEHNAPDHAMKQMDREEPFGHNQLGQRNTGGNGG